MKLIYIAGPFRAANSWDRENNIRRAEELALATWRAGYAVICPHTNTRFFDGAADDKIWLEGDLEILRRCDAVLTTPDWERSTGARAEVSEARQYEIPVFHLLDQLVSAFQYGIVCDRCGRDLDLQGHSADCVDAPGN